jgi:APA family basic amino acid/polyamine antiporter
VSVIYILANIMYLAVVPLYDIATAESDRVAVVASQSILVLRNINHRGDDYDFDFACNNGLIMAGAECIIRWRKTEFSSRKPLN